MQRRRSVDDSRLYAMGFPQGGSMAGRAIRQTFRQGDVGAGMALWRAVNGCTAEPDRREQQAMLRCQIWDRCESGREIRLCLHDGGHSMPGGWESRAHDRADSLVDNG